MYDLPSHLVSIFDHFNDAEFSDLIEQMKKGPELAKGLGWSLVDHALRQWGIDGKSKVKWMDLDGRVAGFGFCGLVCGFWFLGCILFGWLFYESVLW